MKKVFVFFLVTLWTSTYAQMNVDSLSNEIIHSNNFHIIGGSSDYTTWFESFDKRERYYIFIDSLGKLSPFAGWVIIYHEYDEQGREVKEINYGARGEYYRPESYSPIIMTSYFSDTTVKDYYNNQANLRERIITISDTLGRAMQEFFYDENKNFRYRIVKKYTNLNYRFGIVAAEECIYDAKGKLFDIEYGQLYKYSQIRRKLYGDEIVETNYYDSKGRFFFRTQDGSMGWAIEDDYKSYSKRTRPKISD